MGDEVGATVAVLRVAAMETDLDKALASSRCPNNDSDS